MAIEGTAVELVYNEFPVLPYPLELWKDDCDCAYGSGVGMGDDMAYGFEEADAGDPLDFEDLPNRRLRLGSSALPSDDLSFLLRPSFFILRSLVKQNDGEVSGGAELFVLLR